jgi:hypothetical protein
MINHTFRIANYLIASSLQAQTQNKFYDVGKKITIKTTSLMKKSLETGPFRILMKKSPETEPFRILMKKLLRLPLSKS